MRQSNLYVEPLAGYGALQLVWQEKADPQEISHAFESLKIYLDSYDEPVYVLVDISSKPQIPIMYTIHNVLSGIHQHKNLMQWVVVGESTAAKRVASVLNSFSGQEKIVWVGSRDEAIEHIKTELGLEHSGMEYGAEDSPV